MCVCVCLWVCVCVCLCLWASLGIFVIKLCIFASSACVFGYMNLKCFYLCVCVCECVCVCGRVHMLVDIRILVK